MHAFLPVNIDSEKPGKPLLCVVDADAFERVSQFRWQASGSGLVYRIAYDRVASAEAGRRVTHLVTLAEMVMCPERELLAGGSDWVAHVNGDRLDNRLANLKNRREDSSAKVPTVPAGSVIRTLDDYESAILDRSKLSTQLRAKFRAGRQPKLSPQQVREFLDAVRGDPMLKGATLQLLGEYLADTFDAKFARQEVSALLRGRILKLPGYDYSAVPIPTGRGNPAWREEARQRRELRLQGGAQ